MSKPDHLAESPNAKIGLRTFLLAPFWPIHFRTLVCGAMAALVPLIGLRWGAPVWWPVSTFLLFIVMVQLAASIKYGPLGSAILLGFTGLAALANVLLAASYYVQRMGVNQAFVDQLNLNIRFALAGYIDYMLVAVFYVIVTAAMVQLAVAQLRRARPAGSIWIMLIWFSASLVFYSPVNQALTFWMDSKIDRFQSVVDFPHDLDQPQSSSSVPLDLEAGEKTYKSIVIIYMEGLESAFFTVPGLMPELSEIKKRMLVFSNVRQAVGGTIGGLVSTLCGWPPFTDTSLYQEEVFYPGFQCLGDIFEDAGFESKFMGGADLRFTRKDRFFGDHGFHSVLGKNELLDTLPDPTYVNEKWGLHDDSLFALAREAFNDLAMQSERFALVLLTISTHIPGFPAPSCPTYSASDELMLQAVHCTDHLVAGFINYLRQTDVSQDTVIALVSDHLIWGGISDYGIAAPEGGRRLTFMIDRPGEPPGVSEVPGSEFDVGPTLAELLGLHIGAQIGLGSSLLAGPGFLFRTETGLGSWRNIYAFIHSDMVKTRVDSARQR